MAPHYAPRQERSRPPRRIRLQVYVDLPFATWLESLVEDTGRSVSDIGYDLLVAGRHAIEQGVAVPDVALTPQPRRRLTDRVTERRTA